MSQITTWIFPGQGSQAVGMGSEVLASSPAARAVLAEAEAALGESIGKLIAKAIKMTTELVRFAGAKTGP